MSVTSHVTPVFQLRYISTLAEGVRADEVPKILDTARRINRQNRITGLLLFNGERFLQLLEGEEAAVRATFERIAADPRHRGVAILGMTTGDRRAFADWDMAYERLGGTRSGEGGLAEQVAAMVAGAPDRIAREFIGYARLQPARRRA